MIGASIDPRRVVGSLVYLGSEIVEPGVIRHTEGNRISLGEPDGSRSERCRAIAEALVQAGLHCPVTIRLRTEIWVKLLGNVAFNPISALARATLGQMARDADVCAIVSNIMAEVEAVANKWECRFRSRSSSGLQAPRRSGSTKPPCCRIWKRTGRWNWNR